MRAAVTIAIIFVALSCNSNKKAHQNKTFLKIEININKR
jgi:hypothetical protein